MGNGKVLLTREGKEKLEQELDMLIHEKRVEASEKIKIARGFGDLSENAEYDEAKEEQAKIESRILEIEDQLKNVELIKENKNSKAKTVSIGDTVEVTEVNKNKNLKLKIVGTLEADVNSQKISNESPLGATLINSKEGQTVEVKTKSGKLQYKINKIVR